MSRSGKNVDTCDSVNGVGGSGASQGSNEVWSYLDHEIVQLTNLRSTPHEHLSRVLAGKSRLPVSPPVKMLIGREGNYSGRGRFSSADNCHILSQYLPFCGPRMIDKMKSCAYVSQFAADGSLFIAGFQ
ncbi:unnamed protein product, partial [Ilex paraguariensis]